MTILERDKEMRRRHSGNSADDERRRRSPKSSGPEGEGRIWSSAALLLLGVVNTMPRRRALHMTKFSSSKYSYNLCEGQ